MTPHTAITTASASTTATASPVPIDASSALVRTGGVAAQVVAGTYVVGFLAMAAYFVPRGLIGPVDDPSGSLDFLLDHHAELSGWYLVLYLLGGAAMAAGCPGSRRATHPGPSARQSSLPRSD